MASNGSNESDQMREIRELYAQAERAVLDEAAYQLPASDEESGVTDEELFAPETDGEDELLAAPEERLSGARAETGDPGKEPSFLKLFPEPEDYKKARDLWKLAVRGGGDVPLPEPPNFAQMASTLEAMKALKDWAERVDLANMRFEFFRSGGRPPTPKTPEPPTSPQDTDNAGAVAASLPLSPCCSDGVAGAMAEDVASMGLESPPRRRDEQVRDSSARGQRTRCRSPELRVVLQPLSATELSQLSAGASLQEGQLLPIDGDEGAACAGTEAMDVEDGASPAREESSQGGKRVRFEGPDALVVVRRLSEEELAIHRTRGAIPRIPVRPRQAESVPLPEGTSQMAASQGTATDDPLGSELEIMNDWSEELGSEDGIPESERVTPDDLARVMTPPPAYQDAARSEPVSPPPSRADSNPRRPTSPEVVIVDTSRRPEASVRPSTAVREPRPISPPMWRGEPRPSPSDSRADAQSWPRFRHNTGSKRRPYNPNRQLTVEDYEGGPPPYGTEPDVEELGPSQLVRRMPLERTSRDAGARGRDTSRTRMGPPRPRSRDRRRADDERRTRSPSGARPTPERRAWSPMRSSDADRSRSPARPGPPPRATYRSRTLPVKLAGVFLQNLREIPTDPHLDPPPRACFNCWAKRSTHVADNCPESRRRHCENCGRLGVHVSTCPRCDERWMEREARWDRRSQAEETRRQARVHDMGPGQEVHRRDENEGEQQRTERRQREEDELRAAEERARVAAEEARRIEAEHARLREEEARARLEAEQAQARIAAEESRRREQEVGRARPLGPVFAQRLRETREAIQDLPEADRAEVLRCFFAVYRDTDPPDAR